MVKRWDDAANALLHNKIKSGDIDPAETDVKIIDRYNQRYFAEYCELSNQKKKYQARKRLRDKLLNWNVEQEAYERRVPQDPEDEEEEEDYDEEEKEDPRSRSPSPERQPRAEPEEADIAGLIEAAAKLELTMKLYNLDYKMVWLLSTTHFKTTGEKELVLDFVAPPFGVSKFIFDVSKDGKSLVYSVKFPTAFFDTQSRTLRDGTEPSMLATCGEVFSRENSSHDGVETKKQSISLPFPCEASIRAIELIAELPTDDELYRTLREADVPRGSEMQIPLVLRVVLVGLEKCTGILTNRTVSVSAGAFTPPRSSGDGPGDGGGGGVGGGDPFAGVGGMAAFMEAMQRSMAAGAAGAAREAAPAEFDARGGGVPRDSGCWWRWWSCWCWS